LYRWQPGATIKFVPGKLPVPRGRILLRTTGRLNEAERAVLMSEACAKLSLAEEKLVAENAIAAERIYCHPNSGIRLLQSDHGRRFWNFPRSRSRSANCSIEFHGKLGKSSA
jgi:hypothetical protein